MLTTLLEACLEDDPMAMNVDGGLASYCLACQLIHVLYSSVLQMNRFMLFASKDAIMDRLFDLCISTFRL